MMSTISPILVLFLALLVDHHDSRVLCRVIHVVKAFPLSLEHPELLVCTRMNESAVIKFLAFYRNFLGCVDRS